MTRHNRHLVSTSGDLDAESMLAMARGGGSSRNSSCANRTIVVLGCIISALLILCTLLGFVAAYLYDQLHLVNEEVQEEKEEIEELNEELKEERNTTVYHLAGTFTLLGSLVTMFHMTSHLRHFNQPIVQRKILAILWMSPIYSITSWLSLVFPAAEGYFGIIKDFYEAYLIYQFLSFLIAVLGRGDRDVVVNLLARRADHLSPPVRCLAHCYYPPPEESDRAMANAVLLECQIFALQFVLIRPLTSIFLLLFNELHYYGGGHGPWDMRAPQFYLMFLQNLSVFTAFTGLLKFYHAVHEDLEWIRPWPKFLCIKGVVFMTFWQGLVISILAHTADNGNTSNMANPVDWANWIQNFLICFEMLLFSTAHFCYFPWEEWEEGYRVKVSQREEHVEESRFGDSIALRDFASDVQLVISSHKSSLKSRKKNKKDKASASDPSSDDSADPSNSLPSVAEEGRSENNSDHAAAGGTNDGTTAKSPTRKVNKSDDEEEDDEPEESGPAVDVAVEKVPPPPLC